MGNKILFLDTETGGLNPLKHDLLSIGLAMWEDGRVTHQKELLIKGHPRRCTEEALAINRIDLSEHNKMALSKQSATEQLLDFVRSHFDTLPVIVAGHNIGFDVAFLRAFLAAQGVNYGQFFSHRTIDTSSILQYLGLLQNYSNEQLQRFSSSDTAFRNYGIEVPTGQRHTALADAVATAQLFSRLVKEPVIEGILHSQ